jgi:outer membrane lipoprotein SlyB
VAAEPPAPEPVASRPPAKPAAAKATKKHAAQVVAEPAPVSVAPPEKVAQQPPPPPPPKPVCAVCGTIEAVTPVEVKGESKGVGAVAGVLLGGVLGHQVGGGRGKDLATVVGAVGGGVAGNEAEKHYKSTTRYQLQIRMDDGSTRTVMHDAQMMVGQKVTVQNGQVSPAQ